MLKRVRNQAYRALGTVLHLPGNDYLNDVDLTVAQPVHELTAVVQAGLVDEWRFLKEGTAGGAGAVNLNLRPQLAGDWTLIYRNREIVTDAVPVDDVFALLEVGVSEDGSQLSSATIYRTFAGDFFGAVYMPIWYTNTRVTSPGGSALVPAAGTVGGPWWVAENKTTPESLVGRLNVAGATDYAVSLYGISAPVGVLTRRG